MFIYLTQNFFHKYASPERTYMKTNYTQKTDVLFTSKEQSAAVVWCSPTAPVYVQALVKGQN